MPSPWARRLAWLLAPAILAALIALNPLSRPTYVMGDFRAFYCAGAAIAQHANPYLEEPLRGCERDAGPPFEPAFLRPVALPAPLPPYALTLFVPFASLPFPLAAVLYGLLLIAAMTAATALLARVTGASSVLLNVAFAAILWFGDATIVNAPARAAGVPRARRGGAVRAQRALVGGRGVRRRGQHRAARRAARAGRDVRRAAAHAAAHRRVRCGAGPTTGTA